MISFKNLDFSSKIQIFNSMLVGIGESKGTAAASIPSREPAAVSC